MITWIYLTALIFSLLLTLVYAIKWHRHFEVHLTLYYSFVPIALAGYVLFSTANSLETALIANKIIYIGGCFLPFFMMMCVLEHCGIPFHKGFRVFFLAYACIMYLGVLTAGHLPYFYKTVTFEKVGDFTLLHKTYGIMHTFFYAYLFACCIITMISIAYSFFYKKNMSRKIVLLLFVPGLLSFLSFFVGRMITDLFDISPFAYVFSQAVFLLIVYEICLYDVDDIHIESLVQAGTSGFISFNYSLRYLGSNDAAKSFIPELNDIRVDTPIKKSEFLYNTMYEWLDKFKTTGKHDKLLYRRDDKIYTVDIDFLYDGTMKRGYRIFINDDTHNQKYIELIDNFNYELQGKVKEKTDHIVAMHNKLILSMATMVESRDNSTGGHIKRTSEGVRILVGEITADKSSKLMLDETFCNAIIKAAPMHDLGKIAVKDSILQKPGKFEPWEFEEMKKHAAEGARIVSEILEGTDDLYFKQIAENVAHYHHERWDGSGYPDGLKGKDIPLEARIMAIADVYDALVSKRVYKDSMSFEKADEIIMEGFGKHFDESLKPYYVSARPKLEEYYTAQFAAAENQ